MCLSSNWERYRGLQCQQMSGLTPKTGRQQDRASTASFPWEPPKCGSGWVGLSAWTNVANGLNSSSRGSTAARLGMACHSVLRRSGESWWLASQVHCLGRRGSVKGGLCRLENETLCVKEKETEEMFVLGW